MKKVLASMSVLALAVSLVVAAGATAKPPAPKHKKTSARKAHQPKPKPKPKQKPKAQTFDKRFSCASALPTSFLNAQYAASGWSDAATFKGAKDGVFAPNGSSVCSWGHPNGSGGSLMIVYGPGAANLYQRAKATSDASAGAACKKLAAAGKPAPSDPRSCGTVPVSGFGDQAFENVEALAVLRGDVFVEFAAGEKLVDGEYMGGNLVVPPSSLLEAVMTNVLSHVPNHS